MDADRELRYRQSVRPERGLRIGVDATTWWNNRGFGRFTREMVRALLARTSPHTYVLVVDRPPEPGVLPEGAEVVVARGRRTVTEAAVQAGARSPGDMLALSRAVARARFDVFFFPAVYSYFPLFGRTPTVVAFHDTIAERFPELTFPTRANRALWNLKTTLAKWQARRAMTVSEASAQDLRDILRIPEERIDVVTEGADAAFRPLNDRARGLARRRALGIPEDRKLLLYVGGLNPHKNLMGLLAAMDRIAQRRPDAHLAIVGDTSGRGFFDNVAELTAFVDARPALKSRVSFTGYLPDEELVELYADTYALAFPSLWEGFGLPALEAMSCRVPVVASRRGSLPEVIADSGRYFDPTEPEGIARAIEGLLDAPEEREDLARRALERAQTFSWARGAELAEASFERCAGGGR